MKFKKKKSGKPTPIPSLRLLYIINVDWYFNLHWIERAKSAVEAGYDVHVVLGATSRDNLDKIEAAGITIHEISLSRKSFNLIKELVTAANILHRIRKVKPDVVHTVTIKPNIYGGFFCRLLGIPFAASVTGLGTLFSPDRKGLSLFVQKVFTRVYRLVFGGESSVTFFENHEDLNYMVSGGMVKGEQAVKVAGAGVDVGLFAFAPEPVAPPINILFAARLLYEKGLSELVEAVSMLSEKGYDASLLVAGIVDQDAMGAIPVKVLEQWDARGLITWLGQISNMPELFARSHIVCLPTVYGEGIPRVLIEGASCGRALVATDVPGCREIVVDGVTGVLVKPGSVENLADALAKLINDDEYRRELGRNGRRLVEENYRSEIVVRSTLEIYLRLTEKRKRKRANP